MVCRQWKGESSAWRVESPAGASGFAHQGCRKNSHADLDAFEGRPVERLHVDRMTVTSGRHLIAFRRGWERHRHRHCIWIVSPPDYVHHRAFDEVAEGLSEAFSALGGSAPVVRNPIEWRGRAPIILGGNLLPYIQAPALPRDSIIFNLEQVAEGTLWLAKDYLDLLKTHAVLDYSPSNRDRLHRIGIRHAGLLEIGYSPVLTRIPADREKDIDVLFYGYLSERRMDLLEAIAGAGLEVHACHNRFGAERDEDIARSKMVLNVHHYEDAVFEVVRVSYLLANSVPVVSEGHPDQPDLKWARAGLELGPYDKLVDLCVALAADPERRTRLGAAGYECIKSRPQAELLKACIAAAHSAK
jgi:hypothetical protein